MPASTLTRTSSSEYRSPSDGKCSTSGRLTLMGSCKQPMAQLPALAGLTRLPARLAKLLVKPQPQPSRLAQQPGVSPQQIDQAGSNPCSSCDPLSHSAAIPSHHSAAGSTSSTTSTSSSCCLSSAASSTHSDHRAIAHQTHVKPATNDDPDCTGSWPVLPHPAAAAVPAVAAAAGAGPSAQGAHVIAPSLPPSNVQRTTHSPCCSTSSTPDTSSAASSARPSDAGHPSHAPDLAPDHAPDHAPNRAPDHASNRASDRAPDHRILHQAQQVAPAAAPRSPRICMYITELGCGCADPVSCWAAGHARTPSLSNATTDAMDDPLAAAAAAASRSFVQSGGHGAAAAVSHGHSAPLPPPAQQQQQQQQGALHGSRGARRASCSDCPRAFDPSMGDLALLECPLVQSLMLNTL